MRSNAIDHGFETFRPANMVCISRSMCPNRRGCLVQAKLQANHDQPARSPRPEMISIQGGRPRRVGRSVAIARAPVSQAAGGWLLPASHRAAGCRSDRQRQPEAISSTIPLPDNRATFNAVRSTRLVLPVPPTTARLTGCTPINQQQNTQ